MLLMVLLMALDMIYLTYPSPCRPHCNPQKLRKDSPLFSGCCITPFPFHLSSILNNMLAFSFMLLPVPCEGLGLLMASVFICTQV